MDVSGLIGSNPWALAGDFNVVAASQESLPTCDINSDISEFNDLSETIAVFDHHFSGSMFTWSNKHSVRFLERKLDRVLINSAWLNHFPKSSVQFLPPEVSDHCLSYLQLQSTTSSPPKPFKFYNCWVKHSSFLDMIKDTWSLPITGSAMSILFNKLKRLKPVLKAFNAANFGGIFKRVDDKRKALAKTQSKLLSGSNTEELIDLEKTLTVELHDLLLARNLFIDKNLGLIGL